VSELHPSWLAERPVQRLVAALAKDGVDVRFVGGCVRDALLGIVTGDIDLATPARPETVMGALAAARIRAIPTGLEHGTVTAVITSPGPPRHFEITTLRRDVETFGRRARVAFDAGWDEDAARRDFTINAIYLAPDGTLYDPVGGRADLAARRVRFVGDPATRIAEDVLRILRYYRFEARFGDRGGDQAARVACQDAVGKLSALSAERIWRELSGLLSLPNPIRALNMMRDDGVLGAILPEATRIDRLGRLAALSTPSPTLPRLRRRRSADANPPNAPSPPLAGEGRGGGKPADPLLRLAAMIEVDRAAAIKLAERLRLSVAERKRLIALAAPWPLDPSDTAQAQRLALYRLGPERYRDLALLLAAAGRLTLGRLRKLVEFAETWPLPAFPVSGGDVTALGIAPGPRVGRLLAAVKRWWEDGDFAADREECLARLRELAGRP